MKERREYHHGDLARALVDSSVELVRADGVDRFSLRAAARAAGVDPAAVYRHFRDRTALLEAVARIAFVQLADAMADAVKAEEDDAARLTAAAQAYVRHAVAEPELFRLMFSQYGAGGPGRPARDHGPGRGGQSAYALLVDLVGPTLGSDASRESVERAALTAWSGVHGLAQLAVHGVLDGSSPLERAIHDLVAVLQVGLAGACFDPVPADEE